MLQRLSGLLAKAWDIVRHRFDKRPIGSVGDLIDFNQTRSAYVAQTSLYGYLKTRMGTKFPSFFEDEEFSRSIRHASARLFLSCLSDLTVFSVGMTYRAGGLSVSDAADLARHCYGQGVSRALPEPVFKKMAADAIDHFGERIDKVIWPNAGQGTDAFSGSHSDLIRFAPVIDEFKQLDREIVTNSIRFRWRDIREQLQKRLDGEAICRDWTARSGA